MDQNSDNSTTTAFAGQALTVKQLIRNQQNGVQVRRPGSIDAMMAHTLAKFRNAFAILADCYPRP